MAAKQKSSTKSSGKRKPSALDKLRALAQARARKSKKSYASVFDKLRKEYLAEQRKKAAVKRAKEKEAALRAQKRAEKEIAKSLPKKQRWERDWEKYLKQQAKGKRRQIGQHYSEIELKIPKKDFAELERYLRDNPQADDIRKKAGKNAYWGFKFHGNLTRKTFKSLAFMLEFLQLYVNQDDEDKDSFEKVLKDLTLILTTRSVLRKAKAVEESQRKKARKALREAQARQAAKGIVRIKRKVNRTGRNV